MTPDQKFYKTADSIIPAWEGVIEEKVYDRTCFECMIYTADKKRITAYLAPSDSVKGQGEIIIPIKVPKKERKGRNKHPLADVAGRNHTAFGNENRLPVILESFGVNSEGKGDKKKGEFHFDVESSIKGEWSIVISRVMTREPQWRNKPPFMGIISAIGLGQSFQDQVGCMVVPPERD